MTLDFIFQLVFYSHEDVSLNIIFLNVLEGIKQLLNLLCIVYILSIKVYKVSFDTLEVGVDFPDLGVSSNVLESCKIQ